MRVLKLIAITLIGGYLFGIMLSEIIGMIGYVVFDQKIGIKFLGFITAIVSVAAAVVWDRKQAKKASG